MMLGRCVIFGSEKEPEAEDDPEAEEDPEATSYPAFSNINLQETITEDLKYLFSPESRKMIQIFSALIVILNHP